MWRLPNDHFAGLASLGAFGPPRLKRERQTAVAAAADAAAGAAALVSSQASSSSPVRRAPVAEDRPYGGRTSYRKLGNHMNS